MIGLLFLPETMNQNLSDKINEENKIENGVDIAKEKSTKWLDNVNEYTTQSDKKVFTLVWLIHQRKFALLKTLYFRQICKLCTKDVY
jgi:hypothetical protein